MDLHRPWPEATFIIFDTETTGKYPLDAQLCELAAVKWENGRVVDQFQTLIKPTHLIPPEVINIHHITNEMLVDAPAVGEKIGKFHQLLSSGIPVAHHVPFDLGFIAPEFEKARLGLPSGPVLCTSLLSRAVITESPNHRMATLVQVLGLDGGKPIELWTIRWPVWVYYLKFLIDSDLKQPLRILFSVRELIYVGGIIRYRV